MHLVDIIIHSSFMSTIIISLEAVELVSRLFS